MLLHPVNLDEEPDSPNFNNDVVLATLIDNTLDSWKEAQVLYTYPEEHTVGRDLIDWKISLFDVPADIRSHSEV